MIQQSSYKTKDIDFMEELHSNFLIDSWSYSKVSSFARNEKAFEMQYVYGIRPKSSSTTAAGTAYHKALEYFFSEFKDGTIIELPLLEQIAFEHIDEVPANDWKLQKSSPSVDECKAKAYKVSAQLLKNFMGELSTYTNEVDQILEVEKYYNEYVVLNGVEIPLPLHCIIDTAFKLKNGKVAIVDHKSKATFTSEDEAAMVIGTQAMTCVLAFESKYGIPVDEVWFVENKTSQNKDRSPQLAKFKVEMNKNNRRAYEALLYEKVKRMIEAVRDHDYLFLINDSDNFVDRAELYDFWCRTMICEVDSFNVPEAKKDMVQRRLKKIRDASIDTISSSAIKAFKNNAASFIQYDLSHTDMTKEEKIEHALRTRGLIVAVKHVFDGYSSNTYLLEASAGVNISSIYGKRLDIANMLDVPTVRIYPQLIVHEGKSYLGVESSKKREKDLFFDEQELIGWKLPIGKDNFGNTVYWDVSNHSTPHVLVCGATGSGKSVCIRSTIEYGMLAGFEDVMIFDPKYEFSEYDRRALVVNEIDFIEEKMRGLVDKMNQLVRDRKEVMTLVIFDEFADAVAQSKGKELEENLRILLQKGRSCGIRVMAATQRASVKVITGDAKVNFPVQICFRVPKEIDSKVVIDEPGAESLSGRGDGLIKSPEYPQVVRFQAFYKP